MDSDDEAPDSTGATSENLAGTSDIQNIASSGSTDGELQRATRAVEDFLTAARSKRTLTSDGSYPPGVIEACVVVAKHTPHFVKVVRQRLVRAKVEPEDVVHWANTVDRHLRGRAIKLTPAQDLLDRPDPEFLIEGLIQEQSVAMIYAAPRVGKTFIALSWCYAVASGRPWLGRAVKGGPVIYVIAEGDGGIGKRLRALMEAHGDDRVPKDLYVIEQPLNLLDPSSITEATTAVTSAGVEPWLLVLDTYARSIAGGDENSAKDTGLAIAAIEGLRFELNCTVLLVHHTGKNGQSDRGSGALPAAVDTKMRVDRRNNSDDLTLTTEKQKNFPEADPILLNLKSVEDSVVVVERATGWGDVETAYCESDPMAEAILAALTEAANEGRTPITQTALLSAVKGNGVKKAGVLHSMVEDPESLVTMVGSGKSNLYSLNED